MIIIQFTYSVFQDNPDSNNTKRAQIFLKHAVCNYSITKEGNTSVIRSICVLCKILKKINFIGGNFPYVNVDIRGVVLPMSTHVN